MACAAVHSVEDEVRRQRPAAAAHQAAQGRGRRQAEGHHHPYSPHGRTSRVCQLDQLVTTTNTHFH